MPRKTLVLAAAVALGILGTTGIAWTVPKLSEMMPKLAADSNLPQGKDSPGKVSFSHSSHVDAKRPDCTTCHPGQWKMLVKNATADGKPITHKAMEAGQYCGSCHNGKAAFGLKDCDTCHSGK
jgi:c(7)-type cytochrome triheme protein